MPKKIILLLTLFFCLLRLSAQEWSDMKLGVEIGLLDLSEEESFGLFLNVEPQLEFLENMAIGLRVGVTANSLTYEIYDSTQFFVNEESGNGIISFVPTFDYCWNENKFRPTFGLGVGSYLLVSYLDVHQLSTNPLEEVLKVNVNYKIGFLLRGGFELGQSRLGLEYNFVPKADVAIPNGQEVGKVDLSYFGLSIGFTIIGRKR